MATLRSKKEPRVRHEQNKNELKAEFCLVFKETLASWTEVQDILRKEAMCFGEEALRKRFSDFIAFVEAGEEHEREDVRGSLLGIPGRVRFRTEELVKDGRLKKLRDEERARNTPGHKSFQPHELLTRRTYIIIIGAQPFLLLNLRLFMEELAELKSQLLDGAVMVTRLRPLRGSKRPQDYNTARLSVMPDSKGYIWYNLNYAAEMKERTLQKMTDEEFLARIGEE